MFQEIYVIDEHEELTEELKKLFAKEEKLKFRQIETKNEKMIYHRVCVHQFFELFPKLENQF